MPLSKAFFLYPLLCATILAQPTAKYGNLPLAFEENRGQMDSRASFVLRGGNINLFVTKTGGVLSLAKGETRAAVRFEIVGASGSATAKGESPLPGQSSYFRGSDPAKWIAGVPQYEKVRIEEIQRGVDLLCYANQKQFEYDLIVKPGTLPEDIRLRFAGAQKTSLTADGDLRIQTAAGDLIQHKPRIWQQSGVGRETVVGRYEISKNGDVSIAVGTYDRTRELVIDPVVTYSTYLGGSLVDQASAIAVDASGNAYVTGQTASFDFPSTVGAYILRGQSTDIFVSKLNPAGTVLLYSSIFGGAFGQSANAIAIDSSGNAYVTGSTHASNFPVSSGAFQTVQTASSSAFVIKLNASGTALVYSTYLGGTRNDQSGNGIRLDSAGNAYIAGATSASNFPTTNGAYSTVLPGTMAAFITKLNPAGTQLVYSTYLGGSGADAAKAIALDSSNNAYVAGVTASSNFPTTFGAFLNFPTGTAQYSFVSQLSADGTQLTASTYLGGGGSTAIAVDAANNPYVTGYTNSSSFPTTPNTPFPAAPGSRASYAFVTKLNPSLTSLVYSSFLGGTNGDAGMAIAVDSAGNAYVAGNTFSANFPVTAGSLPANNQASQNAFLTQFDPTGSSLKYSTIFGGTVAQAATGVAVDNSQGVYLTGSTSSRDFPVTAGAYQAASTDSINALNPGDAFVTKLDLASPVSCTPLISPTSYTAPLAGGTSSFSLTLPQGCPWALYNQNNSVTFSGPSHGFGNATFSFSVSSNAASLSASVATILIGSARFTVTQPAGSCTTPVFSPSSGSATSAGGINQVSVTIANGCPLSPKPSVPWISVSSVSTPSGSATVSYFVDRNDFASRSGNLLIAGVNFPVTQAAGVCTSSASIVAGTAGSGGTGLITLTTSASTCAWKAYSIAPWIQVASTVGFGSANVTVAIAPNPGTIPRAGQVQIAGQTVTVNQAAGPFGTPPAYTISTVAGNGIPGFSGDGGLATSAMLSSPFGVAYDAIGNLFIVDQGNSSVRKVGLDGIISTVAGTGTGLLTLPLSIAIGTTGDLFIGDQQYGGAPDYKGIIRRVSNGTLSTFANGIGATGLAVDSTNNVYAGGIGYIRKITPNGTVSIIAGSGNVGNSGDGGPPAFATVNTITGLAFDSASNLYLADPQNGRVRRIAGNVINPVVLNVVPSGVAVDALGNLLITDTRNGLVKRLTPDGTLSTIAGTGNSYVLNGFGDGGPALSGTFDMPFGIAVDPSGNIAVSDNFVNLVRLLTPSYIFCSFTLPAASSTAPSAGGSLTPSVATGTGCAWSVLSFASWITPASATGNGPSAAGLQIAANNTGSARTGTVNIAGQTFTVTQQPGVAPLATAVSVSPASGSGTSQTFTAVYADAAGFTALNRRLFLINSTLIGAGGCFIQTDATGIYLVTDAGSGLLGPIAANTTLSNSQCTLTGAGTSVVNSGNNSTVTLALAFAPGFPGAKTIYLYAEDSAGNTGFLPFGSFTVPSPPPPSAVSVTPASFSGSQTTFIATYSDAAGAVALNRRLFLINSSLSGAGACFVQADATGIYLVNDAGSGLLGPLTVFNTTQTNSQCTLGMPAAQTSSGNTATVTVSLTFKAAFAGPKNIYLYADDSFSHNSGFQTLGTYTVTFGAPTADSVTPAASSGTAQTFTATYSDPAGAAIFNRRLFLINSILSGPAACFVQTDSTGIYLVNDAGSGLLGPIVAGATLSNSQCTLNGTGTGVVNSGNTSTVTISLTFKPAFAGAKNIYMYAEDTNGNNSGFQTRGTYTVASTLPTADSVTPSSASGTTQTFTAVYSDGSGATALNRRLFLISSALNGAGACFVQADPTGIYLVNDADSALLGPVTAGSTLSNAQCTLNGTGSSVVNSGNTSTVTLSIAFKPAYAGAKNIYMYADDAAGNSGFQTRGTYTVSGTPSVPTVVSVTPNSGSGPNQTFTLVYSDPAGNSLLNRRLFLINSTLIGAGGCFVEVDPNGIFLANDADSAITGPLAANGTLTNSQCTINGTGASITNSATSTTIVLPIAFKPAFGGSRNLYMYADDTSANNSGFQLMGTVTTQ